MQAGAALVSAVVGMALLAGGPAPSGVGAARTPSIADLPAFATAPPAVGAGSGTLSDLPTLQAQAPAAPLLTQPAPYRPYQARPSPEAPVKADEVAARLKARGFVDVSGVRQRGRSILAEATGPRGERVRLVLDAASGEISGMQVIGFGQRR